jgi:hypothetical protein
MRECGDSAVHWRRVVEEGQFLGGNERLQADMYGAGIQWRDGEYGLTDDGPVRIDIPPDRQSSF